MKILILANARYKGGTSGSDEIYENFKKHWPVEIHIQSLQEIDFKPFIACYIYRIGVAIVRALRDRNEYSFVYSSSDFMADSLAGWVYKLKGQRWIAGFFLKAFRDNPAHFWTQRLVRELIDRFADMVIVTNPTMYDIFPNKKKTWINGGIDLLLVKPPAQDKKYDAVFCGRIHPSKGIDELIHIWNLVRQKKPDARLAVIGDGDLGVGYIKNQLEAVFGKGNYNGMEFMGYMGAERFDIYAKSKVVLYPTPKRYDHFSMAPVEAMACGCPMVFFANPVMRYMFNVTKDFNTQDNAHHLAKIVLKYLDDYDLRGVEVDWEAMQRKAREFAVNFDYKTQALRVWSDINKEISIDG